MSKNDITLFSCTPYGISYPEIERIRRTYGYYDYTAENKRILNAEFCKDIISNKYFFKMGIDNDEKKIYLSVYDINHNLIEKNNYWYFEDIKEKLEIKMKYLALFITKSKKMLKRNYSIIIESSVMSINFLKSF